MNSAAPAPDGPTKRRIPPRWGGMATLVLGALLTALALLSAPEPGQSWPAAWLGRVPLLVIAALLLLAGLATLRWSPPDR